MPTARTNTHSNDRSKILDSIDPKDFVWAVPIMRAGYSGRGLVYLTIAGVSLWSIINGGEAEGTSDAMARLSGGWGAMVVGLIALGMLAYAIWRAVDCLWDLEAYGNGAKGMIARAGMLVTGAIHLAIGVLAVMLLIGMRAAASGGGGGGFLQQAMQNPAGRWALGIAGAGTIIAGGFYLYKAVAEKYLDHLKANHFTMHWNLLLKVGLGAQGVVVAIIGLLMIYAARSANSSQAGGMGSAFDWLQGQAHGRALVVALCLGLFGFAVFCFVNAAYRIVPKAREDGIETLGAKLKEKSQGLS